MFYIPSTLWLGGLSMGRFVGICLVLVSTPALAAGFPVPAAYGTLSACAAFAAGGGQAIVKGDDMSAVLVTPDAIVAAGLICPSDQARVEGGKVVAQCTVTPHQPFTLTATIKEDASARIAKYWVGNASFTLARCD
jgi:hypothetical protein